MKIIKVAMAAWIGQLAIGSAAQGLERQFPASAVYCHSKEHGLPNDPRAKISTQSGSSMAKLSAALVIRDVDNRTIVSGLLPQAWSGMCIFGMDGSLEKLWILTPEQADKQAEAAKAKARRAP